MPLLENSLVIVFNPVIMQIILLKLKRQSFLT